MIMYTQIENSFLEHGEDFNAYIDCRIKHVNACHANDGARKKISLALFAFVCHQC